MRFEDKAEQHTFIYLCVELGKSPMGTKYLLKKTHRVVAVFPEPWSIDGTYGFEMIPWPH